MFNRRGRRGKTSWLRQKQKWQIRQAIFSHSFHDREKAESINLLTNQQIVDLMLTDYRFVHMDLVNTSRGEVIVDSRGEGSFQRRI